MFQELARYTLLNGILGALNMIGRTYIFDWEINNHALPITITKSSEVQSSIQFLLMPHHRCGNATQVLLWSANLIGGSWRPWRRNLTTPTNLLCGTHNFVLERGLLYRHATPSVWENQASCSPRGAECKEDWEPLSTALQALSLVEMAEPVQVRLHTSLEDHKASLIDCTYR